MALNKESINTKLTAADTKAIENQLPLYIESYFPNAFCDTGTLQRMQDLESMPLAEMADIKHRGTNLSLAWTVEDSFRTFQICFDSLSQQSFLLLFITSIKVQVDTCILSAS